MMSEDELRNKHAEDVHELARHHRDFARISAMIDKALGENYGRQALIQLLKSIRNIVG